LGALLNMPLIDRFGLGKVSFLRFFHANVTNFYLLLDPRGRVFLANCNMSCSIPSTSLSAFRIILWSCWDWNGISGSCH
jgi:hypothetical protein